jgi:FkbM family methyltransferase
MNNYFSSNDRKDLFKKRLTRIFEFGRLPLKLSFSIGKLYIQKLFGRKGSLKANADNYYFLTLIHTGCRHRKLENGMFFFQKKNGISFYARQNPGSDLEVFNQVWGRNEYALATEQLLRLKGRQAKINVIDAGANVGYSTLYFLSEFPNAQIVSVEPESANFAMLKKNTTANNIINADLRQNGIWNKACNLKVVDTFRDGFSWSMQVKEVDELSDLRAISLSDIVAEKGWKTIDILKIDIEGSEKQLFDDVASIKKILFITNVLALEIHDEMADRAQIYEILKECGFTYFEHNDLTIAYRQNVVA